MMKISNGKHFFVFLLVSVMLLVPMQVSALGRNASYKNDIIINGNSRANVTMADIEMLLEQRTLAFTEKDDALYESITAALRRNGLREITLKEIAALTGQDMNFTFGIQGSSTNTVRFETINSTFFSGGNIYRIMRIIASPTDIGLLNATGISTVNNRNPAVANVMQFIRIGLSSIAGTASNAIGVIQTVHGALRDIVTAVQPMTTITNIRATYVWSVTERAIFIHVFDHAQATYRLSARFHSATAAVGVNIPTLLINGSQPVAVVRQWNHSGTATPTDYNSTIRAVEAFRQRGSFSLPVFSSSIRSVDFRGIEGQNVMNHALRNPQNAMEAGFR